MAGKESAGAIRKRGVALVREALARAGLAVATASAGLAAELAIVRSDGDELVKVLTAAAPHRRGGSGSLGLHWLLGDTAAEVVALVDLSREKAWLMPTAEFRRLAEALTGGRFHLDWIVVPIGRAPLGVAMEAALDAYAIERFV